MAVHLPGFVSGYLLSPVGSANFFFEHPSLPLTFFFEGILRLSNPLREVPNHGKTSRMAHCSDGVVNDCFELRNARSRLDPFLDAPLLITQTVYVEP